MNSLLINNKNQIEKNKEAITSGQETNAPHS